MKVTPKKNIYKNIKGSKKVKIFSKNKYYDIENFNRTLFSYHKYYILKDDLGSLQTIYEVSLFETISQKRDKILNNLLN